jgi:hypothetical protein
MKGEFSMKLKITLFTIATLLMGATATNLQTSNELCEGFAPPNDRKIPALFFDASQGGITEIEFNSVLDRLQSLYAAEIRSHGGELVINRLWDDSTVNASAEQKNGQWILNMYGGLARHKETTKDGFALVACHEMGHHLGGSPKYKKSWFPWGGSSWASNEGQSDYYAVLKCLRRYFAEDSSSFVIENKILTGDVDPLVDSRCREMFNNTDDQNFCIRNSYAGLSTARLLNDLNNGKTAPNFNTPDNSVVKTTNDSHPAAQCRLDTYFSGSTCTVTVSEKLSDTDYRPGTCYDGNTHKFGLRPRCWFSTKKSIFDLKALPKNVFY